MTVYQQDGYDVRLEWGPDGVRRLAGVCAVVVVVDVLVFTTSVDIAVGRGARVMPMPAGADEADAAAAGAAFAPTGLRRDGADLRADPAVTWTLRPSSLVEVPADTLIAMPSRNGSRLCAAAADTGGTVLAGCLRNATAVAAAAATIAGDAPIAVVPAGERWVPEDTLRPALEELLGAGAITAALAGRLRSPEAEVAALAFTAARPRLAELLTGCVGGRELAHAGVGADVALAAELDVSETVPVLVNGEFRSWPGPRAATAASVAP